MCWLFRHPSVQSGSACSPPRIPSFPPHRRCWGIKAAAAPYTNAAGSVWSAWALLWNHDKNSSKLATLKHKENNNRKSPSVQKGMFQALFSYSERREGGREERDLKRAGPPPPPAALDLVMERSYPLFVIQRCQEANWIFWSAPSVSCGLTPVLCRTTTPNSPEPA